MKSLNYLSIGVIAAALSISACNTAPKSESGSDTKSGTISAEALTVNLDKSFVSWKGDMLGMYSHSGVINISDAELSVEDGHVSGGSFTVDMSSMTPTDEAYNPEEGRTKERLVGHLSSPDFFDVENHPTSTFRIKSVDGSTVTGDLTIRGITHEETVKNVTVTKEGNGYKITGDLTFDRTKYDVSFKMSVQDMVLSDDIELDIELIAS